MNATKRFLTSVEISKALAEGLDVILATPESVLQRPEAEGLI
jgi:hypothetical protein